MCRLTPSVLRSSTTYTTSALTRLKLQLGSCSIRYGYILTIFKIESIDQGIVNDTGDVVFKVVYKALVFRPIQNNVIDAIVEKVDQNGIELSVGACVLFVVRTVS